MPAIAKTLTVAAVEALKKKPGLHIVSTSLYLQVTDTGSASWIMRYSHGGKSRAMGLGSTAAVTLAQARQAVSEARAALLAGRDPITERNDAKAAAVAKAAHSVTFKACANLYLETHLQAHSNLKHKKQWRSTLDRYCSTLAKKPVSQIDENDIEALLRPIWYSKRQTASRVRGRIEKILDWAKVKKYRTGDNPARLRGCIKELLPDDVSKPQIVKHHKALPWRELPAFIDALHGFDGKAALALELVILCASRRGEVENMQWGEVNACTNTWDSPGPKMKMRKPFRRPMSTRAMEILRSIRPIEPAPDAYVFEGQKPGRPFGNAAIPKFLKDMGVGVTTHGFRSSFRDWASERGFSDKHAEVALAHTKSDAYDRTDFFEERGPLMQAWCDFANSDARATAQVVPLHRAS